MEFGKLSAIVAGLLFATLGLWVVPKSLRNIIKGFLSKRWPCTTGKITHSAIRHVGKGYVVDITYTYQVAGAEYAGGDLGFGRYGTELNTANDAKAAEKITSQYPVGSTTTIYYKKGNERMSVLIPGVSFAQVFVLGLGLAWAALGLLGVTIGFRGH